MKRIYVYVKLKEGCCEWRTVRAADMDAGWKLAMEMYDVVAVLEVSLVPGGVVT